MSEPGLGRVTLVVVADLATQAVSVFHAYESRVLGLVPRHGGRLERRLRTVEGTTEVHLLSFASRDGYDAYLADPDRLAARRDLDEALDEGQLAQRLIDVVDVLS